MTNNHKGSGHKSKIRRLIIAGILIIIVIICAFGYQVINSPRYIELPVQPPVDHTNLRQPEGWSSVEYIEETFSGNSNSFYNWRVKKDIGVREGGYPDWDFIDSYFHDELASIGWIPYECFACNPCRTVLPESEFLGQLSDSYQMYIQKDEDESTRYFPLICLAIWPEYDTDGELWMYKIVLATRNPSKRTYWNYIFD